ncbi:Aconitase/3-isopropylmalate dehydratase [Aspergillus tamarii]|uniref:Aconitate hydratase, mitochondrial n=1 Tax=Aspergillus tamarii TaxID=41984 RepID=A0A5N6UD71_ASPTM|nr:Aconitase/3-isopropylmalate dehydratase [Aspergillus tamarii]
MTATFGVRRIPTFVDSNSLPATSASNALLPDTDIQLIGHTRHLVTSEILPVPYVARDLQRRNLRWCIIGNSNYGEGSSHEHAALEPRYLGVLAVITPDFARIHETTLKKQGMLALTFDDAADQDRIQNGDRITLLGVEEQKGSLQPGSQVTMPVQPRGDLAWEAKLNHSYHSGQLPWLRDGSALNHIRAKALAG